MTSIMRSHRAHLHCTQQGKRAGRARQNPDACKRPLEHDHSHAVRRFGPDRDAQSIGQKATAVAGCPHYSVATPQSVAPLIFKFTLDAMSPQPDFESRFALQDINHQDYKGGAYNPRPQYIERRRPHRISVRTPDSARNVLMKELERAEALVKRGQTSPKKSARDAADNLGSDLENLRKSLNSSRNNQKGSSRTEQMPEEEEDLMASIDALSSVLVKLALIEEASNENLAGTASSFVNDATMQAPFKTSQEARSNGGVPQQVNDYAPPTNPPAAAPSEDDPVVRTDMNALDDSSDMCLHSDSIDDADDALANERATGEEVDEEGGYDDDFENSIILGEGDGGEEGGGAVSDEVVDKLNETHKKLDLLERLLTPSKVPAQRVEDAAASVPRELVAVVAPAQRNVEENTVVETVTPTVAAAPVAAAPMSRIASKPFSFKSKGGGAGGGAGGQNNNLMSFFASGPTMLNGNHNSTNNIPNANSAAQPATLPATSASDVVGLAMDGVMPVAPPGAHAPAAAAHMLLAQDIAADAVGISVLKVGSGNGCMPSSHIVPATSEAAVPEGRNMGGGRAGRGRLNLGLASATNMHDADPSPAYQPTSMRGGRAGRGLLDLGGPSVKSNSCVAVDSCGGGVVGAVISRATTALSTASTNEDGRTEWAGGEGGSERKLSAGGKKKISKEEIRRAMLSAKDCAGGSAEHVEAPAFVPPQFPAGRRRIADEEDTHKVPLHVDGEAARACSLLPGDSRGVEGAVHDAHDMVNEGSTRGARGGGAFDLDIDRLPSSSSGDALPSSQPASARPGRRGPVRATGPPRFDAGLGAEAKAAVADAGANVGGGEGGMGGGGGVVAGQRSRSPVERFVFESSLEELDLGGDGAAPRGSGSAPGAPSSYAVHGGRMAGLDLSLDRSLECEEL